MAYSPQKNGFLYEQVIPLSLTVVVMLGLSALVFAVVRSLNLLPISEKVFLHLRLADILVGATIYLKTSVDFAIFMGRLMSVNPGWKNRIAIEIGTALGNGLGTVLVLAIWVLFKEVEILLALMILLASLVLFELAHAGLEHFASWQGSGSLKKTLYLGMSRFLEVILKYVRPIISKVLPDLGKKLRAGEPLPWGQLLILSFSIPFILGLDDFAGYVPLFNVVNVFGFSVGVVAAHMVLNIALFLSPHRTVDSVRNELVSFLGSLAFIALGMWGLFEVGKIFLSIIRL